MAPTLPAPRELDRGLLLLLTGLLFTPISLWALVDLGGRQGASGEVGLMLPATAAGLLFEIYLTHLVRDGVGWARALLIVMNAPLSLMALPIAVGVLIQIGDVPFAMILFALVLMLLLAGSAQLLWPPVNRWFRAIEEGAEPRPREGGKEDTALWLEFCAATSTIVVLAVLAVR